MDYQNEMDGMVLKGEIPQAVDKFFADDATTTEVDGSVTSSKAEAIEKLTGFVGNIAEVREISLLHSASEGNCIIHVRVPFQFRHEGWKRGKMARSDSKNLGRRESN